VLKADSVYLDILELARPSSVKEEAAEKRAGTTLIQSVGRISWNRCEDLNTAQPITFTTPEALLRLPPWTLLEANGSVAEWKFRTIERNGLIVYCFLGTKDGREEFFVVQIVNGGSSVFY